MSTLRFDGADDRIDLSQGVAGATDLAAYTLIGWCWPDSTTTINDNRLWNKASGIAVGAMQMNLSASVTGVRVRQLLSTGTGIRTATSFFTADAWNCVAMTWEQNPFHGGAPRAWRYPGTGTDFTEPTYATTQNGGSGTTDTQSTQQLQAGNTSDGVRGWKGNIGPMALYSRVLTAAEMYAFRQGNPPTDGLVRLWEYVNDVLTELVAGAPLTITGATIDATRDEGVTYSLGPALSTYRPTSTVVAGDWTTAATSLHAALSDESASTFIVGTGT